MTVHRERMEAPLSKNISGIKEIKIVRPNNSQFMADDPNYVKTKDGWELNFGDEDIAGSRIDPKDFIAGKAPRKKEAMADFMECQLNEEITKEYGFDRSRCNQFKKEVERIAERFAETMSCPTNFKDLKILAKMQAAYDQDPYEVDLSDLVVYPIDPKSSGLEAHLPVSCGYNSSYTWSKASQSYIKRTDEINTFTLSKDLTGNTSFREGGIIGDMRFVPIGDGVFIRTMRDNEEIFYYGLVIVPKEDQMEKLACRKQNELKNSSKEKSQILKNEIDSLREKISALRELKILTKNIHRNKNYSEPSAVGNLKRARDLEKLLRENKVGVQKMVTGTTTKVQKATLRCANLAIKKAMIKNPSSGLDYVQLDYETDSLMEELSDWAQTFDSKRK